MTPPNDSNWQVPAHEVALYAERRHAHALVIPVINEGERIRGQLLRIQAAHLPVDVIIADGGSTDGSLDPDFVREAGARAVLTKTGPGKLSAQLRMAYAWCLREGYDGIVTIDGNGKDGVEAVAAMVAKLEEGCDYVQGSRYLPGGTAENTPLERTIANRAIHAPMLSLAARHWFTDTTNGFRAYSARYLTHPAVQPFRDVFLVYNLLFYLTVRAGQLGLKVAHVPVERRYPDSGTVPTKIGGFGPKLALLKETAAAASGAFTPDEHAPRLPSLLWPLLVIAAVLVPLLLSLIVAPRYSPDSWAFYELSQTIFGDFYRFSHWRSYASDAPYSAAFPPLFPSLIALIDGVVGTGARTGLYLSFASFAGFALVSEVIGRRVTGAAWIGLAAALALLFGPNMLLTELGAGRTIPLQLLLYALVLLGLLDGRGMSVSRTGGVGLLTGLAVLNRFDAVLLPLLVAAMIGWLTRSPARALVALATAAMAVSPWVLYSLMTFGTVFATDNSGIAMQIDPLAYVTDWWPSPQPTLADDPAAWFARAEGNVLAYAYTGASLGASPLGAIGAALVVVAAGPVALAGRTRRLDQSFWILAVFALFTAVMMAPQVLTGYLEHRYFSALAWSGLLAVACWGLLAGVSLHQRRVFASLACGVVGTAAVVLATSDVLQAQRAGAFDPPRWADFEAPADLRQLHACLSASPDARVLVVGDDNFAARAGALAGITAMMEPRNIARGRLDADGTQAFLTTFAVDYVLVQDPAQLAAATARYHLVRAPQCDLPLYRPQTWSVSRPF
jgi:hypothetical protein